LGAQKLGALRRQGLLPGVVYGYKVQDGIPVQVDRRTFELAYRRAGASSLIDLHMGDGGMTRVFVHEVTRHPVNHQLMHVDFMAVNLLLPMTTDVALVLTGEAPAARDADAFVMQMMETLHVRALPTHLPSNIEVDISGLTEVGQAIHVRDLQVPADVEVLSDPEGAIVHIAAAQAVSAEEEAADAAAAEAQSAEAAEAAEAAESAADTDADES
jgi:large subunit ribosomal protein L25